LHEKKMNALWIAGSLKALGAKPSIRELAKAMNVAPTTLMRWFEPGEFEREVERRSKWFDSDGSPRDLVPRKNVADG
jgi:DNA-binding transcriptional regulator YhcF (GntR family)